MVMNDPLAIRPIPVRGRSLWGDASRRLLRNKAAVAAGIILLLVVLACFVGPLIVPFELDEIFWDAIMAPPDWETGHLFGTDANGRDLLVRTLNGGQISLLVWVVATAGGRNIVLIFVAIGAVEWLDMARIVRGQTLSIKRKEFIEAARAGGVRPASIIRRHI